MAASDILLRLRLNGQKQAKAGIDEVARSVDHLGDEAQRTSAQTRRAADNTTRMGKESGKSTKRVGDLARKAVALGAGFASIHQARQAVDTTVELGKSTIALNKSFGMEADVAANWAVVAKARGIETKSLTTGFTTLAKQVKATHTVMKPTTVMKNGKAMTKMVREVKAGSKELKELGVSQKIIERGNLQEVIEAASDGLAKMPDGAQKSATMAKLFGKQWQALRPMLAGGSKDLREQLALAEKYVPGVAKSKDSVADLAKAQRESKFASMGLQVAFGRLLIPAMIKMSETYGKVLGFTQRHKKTTQALKVVLIALASAYAANKILSWVSAIKKSTVVTQVSTMWTNRSSLALKRHMIATKLSAAASKVMAIATGALNLVMSANPIVLAVAAIVALAAGFYIAYKKSETFRNIIQAVWGAIKTGFGWVKKNWPTLLAILTGPIGLAVLAIVKNFDKIKSAASRVWRGIKSVFRKGAEIVGNIFKAPINGFIKILKGIKIEVKAKKVLGETIIPGFRLAPFEGLNTLDTGGTVLSGGRVIVGGTGPEILHLNQGDKVTNPRKANVSRDADPFSTSLTGSKARGPRQIVLNLQVGQRQFARAVLDAQELEAALS